MTIRIARSAAWTVHPENASGNGSPTKRLPSANVSYRLFSGHDHLYERIAPQQGIRYFVSGGGGRNLYDFHKSAFDEAGSSEHHFMVVELAGDQMFFEAITPQGQTLDCGVLWRTTDAAAKPQDAATLAWQDGCRAATAWRAPRVTGRR